MRYGDYKNARQNYNNVIYKDYYYNTRVLDGKYQKYKMRLNEENIEYKKYINNIDKVVKMTQEMQLGTILLIVINIKNNDINLLANTKSSFLSYI